MLRRSFICLGIVPVFLLLGCTVLASSAVAEPRSSKADADGVTQSSHKDWDVTSYFNTPDGKTALTAFQGRRYDEAAQLFDVLAREPIPPETEQPARYLAAVSMFYAGDFQGAGKRFKALKSSYPLLRNYHVFFEAEAHRKNGKNQEALSLYRQIPVRDANGERAYRRMMTLAHEEQQPKSFVEAAITYRKHYPLSPELTSMLAEAYEALNAWDKAATVVREIQVKWPSTVHEKNAKQRLELMKIGKKERKKLGTLTNDEQWKRAEKLFSSHRSKEAAAAFSALSKKFGKGTEKRCNALHLVARSWDKLRKRTDSAPWHARAIEECPKSEIFAKILYFSGKSAFQLGKHERALREFATLHQKFPAVSYNDDAWIWEAHIHRSEKRPDRRKAVLKRSLREMPGGDMREQVEWLLIWDLYREKNWNGVIQAVDAAIAQRPRAEHHYAEGRRLYWKARALEKLKRPAEANAIYGAMQELYPFSFYSIMSFQRLRKNMGNSAAEATLRILETKSRLMPFGLPAIQVNVASSPELLRGLELLRMGLSSPALREFSRSGFGKSAGESWRLSELLAQAGLTHKSYEVTRKYRNTYSRLFPAGPVLKLWKLAYPSPYDDLMKRFAGDAGIPSEFGWAIMRTESAFKADAESWANAIGLMQLLVPTAQDLVRKGEPRATASSLKKPEVNIRLGTRFLGQLIKRFTNIALSSAGYNAGPGALGRWVKARKHLPLDEFVEEIPFREARRYVKSVSSSFAVYHYLRNGEFLKVPLAVVP